MADTVASQTLADGPKIVVLKLTNISDGTGESAVTKVDVSALQASADGDTCTGVTIERIWWQCIGMKVQILWDASTDLFLTCLFLFVRQKKGFLRTFSLICFGKTCQEL